MFKRKETLAEPSIMVLNPKESLLKRLDLWVQKKTKSMGLKKEKTLLIENMIMLLEAGMDVLATLEALSSQKSSAGMTRIIRQMYESVEEGSPLWLAMEEAEIFSYYVLSMVRMGEESGRLKENLKAISLQQKRDDEFKERVKSAMTYPALVFFLSLFLGLGIAWFILPKLSTVFDQLNLELPFLTRILMGFAQFLGQYGVIFVPGFIFFIVSLFYFLFIHKKTNALGKRILLATPGIRHLIKEIELARLGYIVGGLLQSGIDILETMNSMSRASTFPAYKKLYSDIRNQLEEGIAFEEIFENIKEADVLIPIPVQKIIHAGSKSGHLPEAFLKIGSSFESKTEQTTKNLSAILEPLLLFIVWSGVVVVALSVILPIYSLIGGFSSGLVQ